MKTSWVVVAAAVGLFSCGNVDSVASVGGGFSAEEETDSTSGALLSNSASTWFPMDEGNTWNFASATSSRTLSFSDVWGGMGWLEGLSYEGQWAGLASS